MKLNIPFSKGKFIDLSLKSNEVTRSLRSGFVPQVVGFDELSNTSQDEQELIDKGYGSNVTVYAIISRLAQAGADIPKVLIDANDPDEIIEEGEVYDMLQRPGVLQGEVLTQYDYFEALITLLLSSGNTYQLGQSIPGFGDIWQLMEILPSGITSPIIGNSYRTPILGYQFEDKQKTLKFSAEEVVQTKYVNPTSLGLSSLEGLSPLQAALFSLTGSTDIQKAIAIMVKNQGARGVLTNKSDFPLKPEEQDALSERVNQRIKGLKNFAGITVSQTDMSYLQIGMTADQLKVIESGVLTDRQLCNAFGVSSRLFNDPANSTFNNVQQAEKSMYTNTVIPTCNKLLDDINRFWLSQWSLRDNKNYQLVLDTSSIEVLQADQKLEAEKDKIELEGVQIIINLPISEEGKKELLKTTYGMSDELVDSVVDGSNTTNNEQFTA